jgi:nicotinate-nucleotide pyrophosphorylase (carboxylating)
MSLEKNIAMMVELALAEDIGSGDITASLLDQNKIGTAKIITREDIICSGSKWVEEVFNQISSKINTKFHFLDGQSIIAGSTIATIKGPEALLLTGERVALNFLQTLSATATQTAEIVSLIADTNTKLLDTRKTIPLWRLAQKYAVTCGGGYNHRMGLYDEVLIKENHIVAAGSISKAVDKALKLAKNIPVVVEVENIEDLKEVLNLDVSRIMLDNFSIDLCRHAVSIVSKKIPLEVSGNINANNIRDYARTGVDFISVGATTKNIRAVDLSFMLEDNYQ